MKRIITRFATAIAVISVLGAQSCDKIKNSVAKNELIPVDYTAEMDIPVAPSTDTTANATFGTQTVAMDFNHLIDSASDHIANFSTISTITITAVNLTITSGATEVNNFANFVYIGATFNRHDNSTQAYTITDPSMINPDVASSDLDLTIVDAQTDVKQYFDASGASIDYLVVGKLRRKITSNLVIHAKVSYHISF